MWPSPSCGRGSPGDLARALANDDGTIRPRIPCKIAVTKKDVATISARRFRFAPRLGLRRQTCCMSRAGPDPNLEMAASEFEPRCIGPRCSFSPRQITVAPEVRSESFDCGLVVSGLPRRDSHRF